MADNPKQNPTVEKMTSEKARLLQQSGPAPQELPTEAYPVSDNREPLPLPLPLPPPPPPTSGGGSMPTVEDPFNFPTDEALPAYSAHASDVAAAAPPPAFADGAGPSGSSSAVAAAAAAPARPSTMKPIAIPQVVPAASSPFVAAYPPCLLARGITETSWRSFLDTVSAFLTAKVGDRAVSHAGDMARHLATDTTHLGKNLASHSKHLGKDIARHARRGNIFGVAATVIAGAVSLPVMTALGAVGTVTRLPGAAIGAVTKKPRTPAERVNAYNVVANDKWLHQRGLHAQLVDTSGLAHVLDLPTAQLLAVARGGKEGSAEGMLQALNMHIESLKVDADATLGLSDKTLWLVLVEFDPAELEEQERAEQERAEQEEKYGQSSGRRGKGKDRY